MWRLWAEGKLQPSEFDEVSLDWAMQAYDVLDAWQDAEVRARRRAAEEAGK